MCDSKAINQSIQSWELDFIDSSLTQKRTKDWYFLVLPQLTRYV